VREALNYAIGRTALIKIAGPYAGTATDQVLMPGLPGYAKYSVYPNSPDIAIAEQVGGSALKGAAPLTIAYTPSSAVSTNTAEYVQAQAEQIGLTAKLDPTTSGPVPTEDNVFRSGWCPDYNDPSFFFDFIVNTNGFHDSSFDQKASHAASLSGNARATAYAALDKLLMTRYAPVMPVYVQNFRYLASQRVHNVIFSHFLGGPILNAMSVR
jgi:peptide/nickel transport system substrate-binding protein